MLGQERVAPAASLPCLWRNLVCRITLFDLGLPRRCAFQVNMHVFDSCCCLRIGRRSSTTPGIPNTHHHHQFSFLHAGIFIECSTNSPITEHPRAAFPLIMTTDTGRSNIGPHPTDCASPIPTSDFDADYDYDYDQKPHPEEPADIVQVFYFLTFTLKEGIQQTVYALFQSLKCTYLLVSELHRPYLDSVRVLVPLWLAVVHAILLVFFVLAHKAVTDALQRLRESIDGPFARLTAWTDHTVPRVFRRLACRSGSALSSVLHSGPSSTMAG